MMHAKLKDHMTFGSGEEYCFKVCTIYGRGQNHLYNYFFSLLKKVPYKIWFKLTMRFKRGTSLKMAVIYMYIALGPGQTTPGVIFFTLTVVFSQYTLSQQDFTQFNDFVIIFPI